MRGRERTVSDCRRAVNAAYWSTGGQDLLFAHGDDGVRFSIATPMAAAAGASPIRAGGALPRDITADANDLVRPGLGVVAARATPATARGAGRGLVGCAPASSRPSAPIGSRRHGHRGGDRGKKDVYPRLYGEDGAAPRYL